MNRRLYIIDYDYENSNDAYHIYELLSLIQKMEVIEFDHLYLERDWLSGLTLTIAFNIRHFPRDQGSTS